MSMIEVSVCTGTTCYVMGAADLLTFKEHLDGMLASRIDVKGVNCFDCCKDETQGQAPFVKVNDTVIADATVAKIVEEVRRQAT
jgi:NADH:ubiquinone oxidoreductase subunit E